MSSYDERMYSGPLGDFGRYVIEIAYDEALADVRRTIDGTARGPEDRTLHNRLSMLSDDGRQAAEELARGAVVSALHGLLHGLSHDVDRVRLLFDGHDVAQVSDGLQGDLFDWIERLSRFSGERDRR